MVDVLDAVAAETGKTISQIAIAWLLSRPSISSVIIGARNKAQLRDNLGAVGWSLTIEILFLGLSVSAALSERVSRLRIIASTVLIALLLPFGAIAGTAVASLPDPYLAPFFAFGLIAMLYLVTEEFLVDA